MTNLIRRNNINAVGEISLHYFFYVIVRQL
nr:MAG TPA: hypothetical protein [Caudoviricetes sp.]